MCTAKSSLCSPLDSSARLLQNAAERQRCSRSGRPQPRRSPGEIGPLLVQADSVAAEETTDCRQVIEAGRVSDVCVLRSCSFISFSLGVIKPRIQSEFHNLGVDDVVVGVPNRSWPHFNHRRPFRSSSSLFRRDFCCLDHGHMYQVLWWPLLDVNQLRMEQVLLQLSSTILRAAAFISDFASAS